MLNRKYDIEEMLKEIEEDEKMGYPREYKMSQEEIQKMIADKQKERKGTP